MAHKLTNGNYRHKGHTIKCFEVQNNSCTRHGAYKKEYKVFFGGWKYFKSISAASKFIDQLPED